MKEMPTVIAKMVVLLHQTQVALSVRMMVEMMVEIKLSLFFGHVQRYFYQSFSHISLARHQFHQSEPHV